MLIGISNAPRDSAWGSPTLIAELEGREPTGAPEAEVWFGDHPASPSAVLDGTGRTLDQWLAAQDAASGTPPRLPYLLKLLAAASTLSIQAHPSKAHAEAAFAREEAAGIPMDAAHRSYRDDNHKPELIVALSERFEALVGVRDLAATRRLLKALGDAAAPVQQRLDTDGVGGTVGWLLSGDAQDIVDAVIAAATTAESDEFGFELEVSRRLATAYPGDPGVVVALLMNVVTLCRGEGVYVGAGVLHAYLAGLGVELMAASDNVMRGGLTPKPIDVPELLAVLDESAGAVALLQPEPAGEGVERFAPGIPDFALLRVESVSTSPRVVETTGTAIVLATAGEVAVRGAVTADPIVLRPGQALLATPAESPLQVVGAGEVFVAQSGI